MGTTPLTSVVRPARRRPRRPDARDAAAVRRLDARGRPVHGGPVPAAPRVRRTADRRPRGPAAASTPSSPSPGSWARLSAADDRRPGAHRSDRPRSWPRSGRSSRASTAVWGSSSRGPARAGRPVRRAGPGRRRRPMAPARCMPASSCSDIRRPSRRRSRRAAPRTFGSTYVNELRRARRTSTSTGPCSSSPQHAPRRVRAPPPGRVAAVPVEPGRGDRVHRTRARFHRRGLPIRHRHRRCRGLRSSVEHRGARSP